MKLGLLVLTVGKQEGKVLEIKLPQFLIGRDPQCNLRPASPMISKRHCAIIQRDGKAFIRDFGSTNGTYLNDERVEGESELKNEDQLKVGPILFSVRLEEDAQAANTPIPVTKPAAQPAANKTPAPPTRPVAKTGMAGKGTPVAASSKSTSSDDDVDIAGMLQDMDDGAGPSLLDSGEEGVPEGSTVMELRLPPEVVAAMGGDKKEAKPAPKPGTGDTRSAAAKILEQMTKRPRS